MIRNSLHDKLTTLYKFLLALSYNEHSHTKCISDSTCPVLQSSHSLSGVGSLENLPVSILRGRMPQRICAKA